MTREERAEKRLKAIELRKSGYTLSEIAKELHISKASASSYVSGISISEEILEEKFNISKEKTRENNILRYSKQQYEHKLDINLFNFMTPVQLGLSGELFAKYKLFINGYKFYEPSVLEPGCDILVLNSNNEYKRCEVKSSIDKTITFRHSVYNGREHLVKAEK